MNEIEIKPDGYVYSEDLLQSEILRLRTALNSGDNRFIRYRRQELLGIQTKYSKSEMIEHETLREEMADRINEIEAILLDEVQMNEIRDEEFEFSMPYFKPVETVLE